MKGLHFIVGVHDTRTVMDGLAELQTYWGLLEAPRIIVLGARPLDCNGHSFAEMASLDLL